MISITLPDGNIKNFEQPLTGLDLAVSISEGLARNCVAMQLGEHLVDLNARIDRDAVVRLVTTKDPEALAITQRPTFIRVGSSGGLQPEMALGDLVITGPTRTNVGDIQVVMLLGEVGR